MTEQREQPIVLNKLGQVRGSFDFEVFNELLYGPVEKRNPQPVSPLSKTVKIRFSR